MPLSGAAAAVDGTEPLLRRGPAVAPESAEGFAQRPQGRAVQSAADTPPQIAYSVSNGRGASAVVRLNPLTGRVRTVIASGGGELLSVQAWSAADGRISYSRTIADEGRVDSVPQAGGAARAELADASSADVAPNGRTVVFSRSEGRVANLFAAGRGGTGVRRLTGAGGFSPRFSADGSQVVFSRALRSGSTTQADLFTLRTDGTGLRRVTATRAVDELIGSFSPDGRRLLFSGIATDAERASFSVYSVGVDGRGVRLVERNAFASDWAANGWVTYLSFGGQSQAFGQDQVVVRAPGRTGRRTVLTRETSFIDAVRFAR